MQVQSSDIVVQLPHVADGHSQGRVWVMPTGLAVRPLGQARICCWSACGVQTQVPGGAVDGVYGDHVLVAQSSVLVSGQLPVSGGGQVPILFLVEPGTQVQVGGRLPPGQLLSVVTVSGAHAPGGGGGHVVVVVVVQVPV